MKKKNIKKVTGFTLIELLAVIVILAIIALISTPIIIGVIEKARKGAFEDSAYGVLDAGRVYFVDKLADENKFVETTFIFPEGGDLKISGEKPGGGIFVLDSDGKSVLAVYDKEKKWCALKSYNEEKIIIKEYDENICQINSIIIGAGKTIVDKNVEGNAEGLFTDDFGNTRYRGNNPKNYVIFNQELWRIIGVFDGKVKIIRDERIPNPNDGSVPYNSSDPNAFKWDSHTIATGAESNYGKNDWSTSDLQEYLNNGYYSAITEEYRNMIAQTKYSLGGILDTKIDKKKAYQLERENTVYTRRPTEWTGKISLSYLSDYGYAVGEECTQNIYAYDHETCKNHNYLYKSTYYWWLLTAKSNSSSIVSGVSDFGRVSDYYTGNTWLSVRPSLYLKPSVTIISGDGTSAHPYTLSL